MQAHHVRLTEQFFYRTSLLDAIYAKTLHFQFRLRAKRQHFHAHSGGNASCSSTSIAQTYHSEGPASKFSLGRDPKGEVGISSPATFMHHPVMLCHIIRDMKQVGNGKLCHRLSAVCRNIRNNNATLLGCSNVNDIISCSEYTYIT